MFLHIGNDIAIKTKDIIIILDIETIKKSKINKMLLREYNINSDIKSCIITKCNNSDKNIIYFSSISSITLQKRTNYINQNIMGL